jgi:hypothetical protein
MPLYPAFWFLATRPCRPRRILAVFLAASPFLVPLWVDARSSPRRSNHTYRYVSEIANRILPYETTQNHLKPSGRSDVVHRGLWVKFLSPSLREKRDGTALLLNRGSRGSLLLAVREPLEGLELQTLGDPEEKVLVVGGADILEESPNARGRLLSLELGRLRARHSMWWSWAPLNLYELTLESESTEEGRLTFTLRAVASRDEGGL